MAVVERPVHHSFLHGANPGGHHHTALSCLLQKIVFNNPKGFSIKPVGTLDKGLCPKVEQAHVAHHINLPAVHHHFVPREKPSVMVFHPAATRIVGDVVPHLLKMIGTHQDCVVIAIFPQLDEVAIAQSSHCIVTAFPEPVNHRAQAIRHLFLHKDNAMHVVGH